MAALTRNHVHGRGADARSVNRVEDEIDRCAGLPLIVGGTPLHEVGATGFGLAATRQDHVTPREAALTRTGAGCVEEPRR